MNRGIAKVETTRSPGRRTIKIEATIDGKSSTYLFIESITDTVLEGFGPAELATEVTITTPTGDDGIAALCRAEGISEVDAYWELINLLCDIAKQESDSQRARRGLSKHLLRKVAGL